MCLTNVIDCLRHEHVEHCEPAKSRPRLALEALRHWNMKPGELIELSELLRGEADEAE